MLRGTCVHVFLGSPSICQTGNNGKLCGGLRRLGDMEAGWTLVVYACSPTWNVNKLSVPSLHLHTCIHVCTHIRENNPRCALFREMSYFLVGVAVNLEVHGDGLPEALLRSLILLSVHEQSGLSDVYWGRGRPRGG